MTASKHSPSFTEWPAELRLAIYRQLITDCLRHGSVLDMTGLYLSCRAIHQEIKAEYMGTIRPLLIAKHRWETGQFASVGHFSVHLQTDPHLDPHASKVHIAMPLGTTKEYLRVSTPAQGVHCLSGALRPVLSSPWFQLSLAFGGKGADDPHSTDYEWAFSRLFDDLDSSVFAAPRMQRLVISFREHQPLNMNSFHFMLSCLNTARQLQYATQRERRSIERASISRTLSDHQPEWSLTIDLDPHLEPVENTLWTLQDDDDGVPHLTTSPKFSGPSLHVHHLDMSCLWKIAP